MNTRILFSVIIVIYLTVLFTTSASASASDIFVPENYTTIQQAVDNADPGDTVIVEDGTYNENVEVNKRLTVKSRNGTENCVIRAENSDIHVFRITADHVNITGFSATGTTRFEKAGIYLEARNCNISNNNVYDNKVGIFLSNASINNINKNTVSQSAFATLIRYSNSNIFANNTFSDSQYGVTIRYSQNNILFHNQVLGNNYGIYISFSKVNTVYLNDFVNNNKIILSRSTNSWNTTESIPYNYQNKSLEGYMGNYWHDYEGTDENGDGIGDVPHGKVGSTNVLMEPFENYSVKSDLPTRIPTPIPTTSGIQIPGFEAMIAACGLLLATLTIYLRKERKE
ncbi:MAG: NosD domain-containing protein [Archaeoglobaceae archaeon]